MSFIKTSKGKMHKFSLLKYLEIAKASKQDYEKLSKYHYREEKIGPFVAIFSLKAKGRIAVSLNKIPVGVIVYSMPTPSLELRNIALNDIFSGLDRQSRLSLINANIRTISRVIIEPRFRNLGLASMLVSRTMPLMDVPIIEAMAVMGLVNPFFEKAGMTAYKAPLPARCVQMLEAFYYVRIRQKDLIDAQKVNKKIGRLGKSKSAFIEDQISSFLQSYGKRRYSCSGIERTRYVLSKLTARPVYYIWFNSKFSELKLTVT